jgi:phage/plasmid-associated DNA primase
MTDSSDGHYRREIVVSFPNQFEEGKNANPNLKYELTSEEELSGIFNVLMSALRNRILKAVVMSDLPAFVVLMYGLF